MTASDVDRIVAATLYEGYVLYPYRPSSVKNQVRWTFGGVHPRAYAQSCGGSEAWTARTECLCRAGAAAAVSVHVRFLHLVTRTAAALPAPAGELTAETERELRPVAELSVAGVIHRSWEEAVERDIDAGRHRLADLVEGPRLTRVTLPATRQVEALRDPAGAVAGGLIRECEPIDVEVEVSAAPAGEGIHRVAVMVRNISGFEVGSDRDRERALRRSLVSAHAILEVAGGVWLSLADPPEAAREAAAACTNTGLWPVLIGEPGAAVTVLASPIILDDHPQVAPESRGDLFDATEIDEILSLRILTLTDAEKAEMRAADERTRALLDRTEALTGEDWMRMHGAIRELRPVRGEGRDGR